MATGLGTTSGLGATSGTATGLEGTAAGIGAGTYGKVILTIKSAHNMRDKAWLGKSDPYCVVKLADAEIQTHHVKNAGEHCVWDESFAFNNVSPDDVIEFHVYDHNRLMKDAHMGEGSISLRQVFEEGRMETRVPLTTRSGTKDAGEIWITLRSEGGPMAGAGAGVGTGVGVGTTAATERRLAGEEGLAERRTGAEMGATGMGAEYPVSSTTTTERRAGYEEGYEGRERVGREGATTAGMGAVPAVATEYTAGTAPVTASTTTTYGTTGVGAGEVAVARQGEEVVCGQEYFTKVEDRPVMKERVTYLREHRPVEKEFVVETRATGAERETGERVEQHMGAEEKVVEVAQPVVEQPTAEYFSKVEDRPVMKERVTRMREHVPVEKEFVVETRATGAERETGERAEEHMGAQERIVEVAQPRAPCE